MVGEGVGLSWGIKLSTIALPYHLLTRHSARKGTLEPDRIESLHLSQETQFAIFTSFYLLKLWQNSQMKSPTRFAIAIFCLSFAGMPTGFAIEVASYSAAAHDRFENDGTFIESAFDFSGVGRSTGNHWVTMISDTHFVTAEHFRPTNQTVRFYFANDPLGGFEERLVDGRFGMEIGPTGSDIWLGKLTAATSTSVTSYDLFKPYPLTNAELEEIYTVGISDGGGGFTDFRVGTNQIDLGSITQRDTTGTGGVLNNQSYSFTYNTIPMTPPNESFVEVGDSGAPSFVNNGGVLQLIGTHSERFNLGAASASNGDISYDSFVGAYGDEIGFEAVPEPGSALLIGVGSAFFLVFFRRRRVVQPS